MVLPDLPKITTVEAVGGEHPEKKKGEIFLGNGNQAGFDQLSYVTKRKGVRAYDRNDRIMPQYFPMFVSDVEYATLHSK